MKFFLCFMALLALAVAQEEPAAADAAPEADGELRPRIYRRTIPSDVLRDFPNYCFASTSCKLYEPGQDWDLAPFCGRSHCMFDPNINKYLEVVFDCGPKPENPKECKVMKSGNTTASFPECCDVYDLETCEFPIPKLNPQGAPSDAPGKGTSEGGQGGQKPEDITEEDRRHGTQRGSGGRRSGNGRQ